MVQHRPGPGRDRGGPGARPHARDGGPHLADPGLRGPRDRFGDRHLLAGHARAGVWSRVAGDVLDLATLASAYRDDNPKRDNVAAAIASIVGITWVDYWWREAAPQRPAARVLPRPSAVRRRRAEPPHRLGRIPGGPSVSAFGAAPAGVRPGLSRGDARLSSGDHPNSEDLNTRGASMRAICWHGKGDVRVDTVPDPKIEDPRDAIIRITSTCICGSRPAPLRRLHADDGGGRRPRPRADGRRRGGRQVGHEAQEGRPRGRPVHDLLRRPAGSASGQLYSLCDNSNPNAEIARKAMGQSPGGPVRLLAHARRLRRRPGRVPPRAVRRRRPDEDPRRHPRREGACSSPTSSRPATWPPRTPRSSRATRSRSGAAGRWPSSPSAAPGCSGPAG